MFNVPGCDDRFEVSGRIEDTTELPALLETTPLRIEDAPPDREKCDAVTGLISPDYWIIFQDISISEI